MAESGAAGPLDRLGQVAGSFLAWWLGNLRPLAPAPLRRLIDGLGARGVIDVDLTACRMTVRRQGPDGSLVIGGSAFEAGFLRRAFGDAALVLRRHRLPLGAVRLRVDSGAVLRRAIRVPPTSARTLRAAIGFDLDRQLPLRADQVYFDVRVTARGDRNQPMRVDLFAIERDTAAALLDGCRAAGLTAASLGVIGEPLDFLNGAGGAVRRRHAGPWLSAAASVVLALGLVAAERARQASADMAMQERLAAARAELAAVADLRRAVAQAADAAALVPRARAADRAALVIADLSRALPDGSWLTDLSLSGDTVEIAGLSGNAAALVQALASAPRFANVRLTAPVTDSGLAATQRFVIGFEVSRDGSP